MTPTLNPVAILNNAPAGRLKNPLAAGNMAAGAESGATADTPAFTLPKLGSGDTTDSAAQVKVSPPKRHARSEQNQDKTTDVANPVLAMLHASDHRPADARKSSDAAAGTASTDSDAETKKQRASDTAQTEPATSAAGDSAAATVRASDADTAAAATTDTATTTASIAEMTVAAMPGSADTSPDAASAAPNTAAATAIASTPAAATPSAVAAAPAQSGDGASAVLRDVLAALPRAAANTRSRDEGGATVAASDARAIAAQSSNTAGTDTGIGGNTNSSTAAVSTTPADSRTTRTDALGSIAEMIGDAMRLAAASTNANRGAGTGKAVATADGTDPAPAIAGALLPDATTAGQTPTAVKSDPSITLGAFLHLLGDGTKVQGDASSSMAANRGDLAQTATLAATQMPTGGASSTTFQLSSPVPTTLASTSLTLQPGWQDVLGSRVDWMLNSGVQEAKIDLHPRDLGNIQIHIRLGVEGADVRFSASHADVRHALESSLPKLREMLASDGVALSQAQVGSQAQQQGSLARQFARSLPASPGGDGQTRDGNADTAADTKAVRVRVASVSLVDDYA